MLTLIGLDWESGMSRKLAYSLFFSGEIEMSLGG